jgi:hypothetical protein
MSRLDPYEDSRPLTSRQAAETELVLERETEGPRSRPQDSPSTAPLARPEQLRTSLRGISSHGLGAVYPAGQFTEVGHPPLSEVLVYDPATLGTAVPDDAGSQGAYFTATMELVGRIAAPRVSVVIPALNEADNLRYVLPKLPGTLYEVILVDGGSSDETVEVTKALCPGALVITQRGRGKGNALSAGFAAASGDIIVMLDADGSADPGEIPKFVSALLEGNDFAKGTRFSNGGGSSDISWNRRVGHRGLLILANWIYRTKYTDLCYGFNAFWAHCLPRMAIDCDGFEVETLMHIRIAQSGLTVKEVGSFEARRIFGNSNLRTVRDGLRVLNTIWSERPRRVLAREVTEVGHPAEQLERI